MCACVRGSAGGGGAPAAPEQPEALRPLEVRDELCVVVRHAVTISRFADLHYIGDAIRSDDEQYQSRGGGTLTLHLLTVQYTQSTL